MKVLRRITIVVFLCTAAICAVLVSAQISQSEISYPMGTRYSVSVNFSGMQADRASGIEGIGKVAQRQGSPIYFAKVDPDDYLHKVDVFVFGGHDASQGKVHWFKMQRYGELKPASQLIRWSLSGTYSLADEPSARAFVAYAKSVGAAVLDTEQKHSGLSSDSNSGLDSMSQLAAAVFLLLAALAWAYAAFTVKPRTIQLLCGISSARSLLDNLVSRLTMAVPISVIAVALIALVASAVHAFANVGTFISSFLCIMLFALAAYVLLGIVADVLLSPRVAGIARRSQPFRLIAAGADIIKVLCVALAALATVFAVFGAGQARTSVRDVEAWVNAKEAVSVTMSANDDYFASHKSDFERFFDDAEQSGNLALSYSAAPYLIDYNAPTPPSAAQISKALAPYDDVVICNRTFLRLFHVDMGKLHRTDMQSVPAATKEKMKDYGEMWLNKGAPGLDRNLYSWSGDSVFPALNYTGGDGSMTGARHPLIILVDRPAANMSVEDFLFPALSSENVVFPNRAKLERSLPRYGLTTLVTGISSVADVALVNLTNLRQMVMFLLLDMAVCLVVIVLCIYESTRIWALRRRDFIFVQCANGRSPMRVGLSYVVLALLVCAVVVCGVGAFAIQMFPTASVAFAAALAFALYSVTECLFCVKAVDSSFTASVGRQ